MRKTIATALIALTVMLALASCGGILTGQNEDGLVTLSINTGETLGSRSLTAALAHGEGNYVEVIFKYTAPLATLPTYYRTDGYYGPNLKIKIPQATYNTGTANDAILFIGRKSDGTLLAIGTIHSDTVVVNSSSVSITFDVVSLEANISAVGTSSFSIDNPQSAAFSGKTISGDKFDGAPCFQVPVNTSGIDASLAISGFSAAIGANTIVSAAPSILFNQISSVPAITVGAFTPGAAGDDFDGATPGKIDFKFTTFGEGKYMITFDFPVVGFTVYDIPSGPGVPSTTPGLEDALTWHIRAGTKSGIDFVGPTKTGVPTFKGDPAEGVALLVTASPAEYSEASIIISYP